MKYQIYLSQLIFIVHFYEKSFIKKWDITILIWLAINCNLFYFVILYFIIYLRFSNLLSAICEILFYFLLFRTAKSILFFNFFVYSSFIWFKFSSSIPNSISFINSFSWYDILCINWVIIWSISVISKHFCLYFYFFDCFFHFYFCWDNHFTFYFFYFSLILNF